MVSSAGSLVPSARRCEERRGGSPGEGRWGHGCRQVVLSLPRCFPGVCPSSVCLLSPTSPARLTARVSLWHLQMLPRLLPHCVPSRLSTPSAQRRARLREDPRNDFAEEMKGMLWTLRSGRRVWPGRAARRWDGLTRGEPGGWVGLEAQDKEGV